MLLRRLVRQPAEQALEDDEPEGVPAHTTRGEVNLIASGAGAELGAYVSASVETRPFIISGAM